MSTDFENYLRRIDKLRNNYENLINQVRTLSEKNRELYAQNIALSRDLQGLCTDSRIAKIFDERNKELEEEYKNIST